MHIIWFDSSQYLIVTKWTFTKILIISNNKHCIWSKCPFRSNHYLSQNITYHKITLISTKPATPLLPDWQYLLWPSTWRPRTDAPLSLRGSLRKTSNFPALPPQDVRGQILWPESSFHGYFQEVFINWHLLQSCHLAVNLVISAFSFVILWFEVWFNPINLTLDDLNAIFMINSTQISLIIAVNQTMIMHCNLVVWRIIV